MSVYVCACVSVSVSVCSENFQQCVCVYVCVWPQQSFPRRQIAKEDFYCSSQQLLQCVIFPVDRLCFRHTFSNVNLSDADIVELPTKLCIGKKAWTVTAIKSQSTAAVLCLVVFSCLTGPKLLILPFWLHCHQYMLFVLENLFFTTVVRALQVSFFETIFLLYSPSLFLFFPCLFWLRLFPGSSWSFRSLSFLDDVLVLL